MTMQNRIAQTLRLAMQDKKPEQYKQMEKAGTLDEYLELMAGGVVNEASEAVQDTLMDLATEGSKIFEPDSWKRVQKVNMANKTAEEAAMQNALEQIEALE